VARKLKEGAIEVSSKIPRRKQKAVLAEEQLMLPGVSGDGAGE